MQLDIPNLQQCRKSYKQATNNYQKHKKSHTLQTQIKPTLQNISHHCTAIQLFKLLRPYQSAFTSHKIPKPKLQQNDQTIQISLYYSKIINQQCLLLVDMDLPNLRILNLWDNLIGKQGCKYLIRGLWPNLQEIDLSSNKICDDGCQILVHGDWPVLRIFTLWNNQIGYKGCCSLMKGNWPNLETLYLTDNSIVNGSQVRSMLKQRFTALTDTGL